MSSEVTICNMALSHLGTKSRIQSLDEASTEARELKLWYDEARRATLEASDWSFAQVRLELTDHTNDPPDTWAYRYQWPNSVVAVRRIPEPGNDDMAAPFKIEQAEDGSRSILTNVQDAVALCTKDESNTLLFTAQFRLTFSYLLAFHCCPKLGPVKGKRKELYDLYVESYGQATDLNASQQTASAPIDAAWIAGR